jgi:hypothetical protein
VDRWPRRPTPRRGPHHDTAPIEPERREPAARLHARAGHEGVGVPPGERTVHRRSDSLPCCPIPRRDRARAPPTYTLWRTAPLPRIDWSARPSLIASSRPRGRGRKTTPLLRCKLACVRNQVRPLLQHDRGGVLVLLIFIHSPGLLRRSSASSKFNLKYNFPYAITLVFDVGCIETIQQRLSFSLVYFTAACSRVRTRGPGRPEGLGLNVHGWIQHVFLRFRLTFAGGDSILYIEELLT